MADIILEEQDGQDHVYNGVRVLSVRNASGSGRTNFLEQNGTVVTSVNGKFGDVEITQEDIPDNSLFTIKEIVDSLPSDVPYSYNEEDGYYEFTESFDYEFKGSKDYFTMLLEMDAMFIGEGESWKQGVLPEGDEEKYVLISTLSSASKTPQESSIPPEKYGYVGYSSGGQIIPTYHVISDRPFFKYYTYENGTEENKGFVSIRGDIKSNIDFSLNQLRVVCPRE